MNLEKDKYKNSFNLKQVKPPPLLELTGGGRKIFEIFEMDISW